MTAAHTLSERTRRDRRPVVGQLRAPRTVALPALLLAIVAGACSDSAPTEPGPMSAIAADVSDLDFGSLDVRFGVGQSQTVTITNGGDGPLVVSAVTVVGGNASAFIYGGDAAFTVAPGASRTLDVAFDPASAGGNSAMLRIASNASASPSLDIALTGQGLAATYRQVDRMGIPTLNTVFNHPPVFSKRTYNTASPANDLAAYRTQFETVLGAVANANPAATAALLLPDALPVNLGAGTTRFAELTGRALADDAVDVALLVTVGVPSLQSDNVNANDKPFLTAFPYLATPH